MQNKAIKWQTVAHIRICIQKGFGLRFGRRFVE